LELFALFINFLIPENKQLIEELVPDGLNNRTFSIHIPNDLSSDEIRNLVQAADERFLRRKEIQDVRSNPINSSTYYTITNDELPNVCVIELSHFYIYDNWVSIRSGVFDRYLRLNISHFIGRIADFYNDNDQDVFFIKWDTTTLNRIPILKIRQLLKRKISPFGTFVSTDLILPVKKPEKSLDAEQKQLEIYRNHLPKKFELEFQTVFNGFSNQLKVSVFRTWENYLQNFILNENHISCLTKSMTKALITAIAGSDEKNGVWVELKTNNNSIIIPLNDVEDILLNPIFEKMFHFYQHWCEIFCY